MADEGITSAPTPAPDNSDTVNSIGAALKPQTNTNAVIGDIDKGTAALTQSLATARNTFENSAYQRDIASTNLSRLVDNTGQAIDKTYGDISTALDKQGKIASYPKIVGEVLGLFDNDWNERVQENAVKRGGVSLQLLDQKLKLGQESANIAISAANEQDQTAARVVGSRVQDVAAGTTRLAAGAQAASLRGEETTQLINGMSDSQLAAGARDGTVPPGMVQAEQQRRASAKLSLEGAAQSLKLGNMQLYDKQTNDYLSTLTAGELQQKSKLFDEKGQKNPDGTITLQSQFGPVKFRPQQITTALAAREKLDDTQRTDNAKRAEAISVATNADTESQALAQNIASINGILPPVIQAQLSDFQKKITAAGTQGSPEEMQRLIDERRKLLHTTITDVTKGYDKPVQPAVTQYLQTGKLDTAGAGAVMLSQSWTGNPFIGSRYGDIGSSFSSRVTAAAKGKNILAGGGDANSLTLADVLEGKTHIKGDQLVAEAVDKKLPVLAEDGVTPLKDATGKIRTQSLRDQYAGTTWQLYLNDTFDKLNKPIIGPDGKAIASHYNQYADSSGSLDARYARNPQMLIKDLETNSALMQQQGKLTPDANLAAIMLKELQDKKNLSDFEARLHGSFSMNEHAMSKTLANGREGYILQPFINDLHKEKTQTAKNNTLLQEAARRTELERQATQDTQGHSEAVKSGYGTNAPLINRNSPLIGITK